MKHSPLSLAISCAYFVLTGCSRELPLESGDKETSAEHPVGHVRTDKELHAIDLGPPAMTFGLQSQGSLEASSASVTSIPFAPEPGPFANSAGLFCDDCTQQGFPIGFSFTFFGNTYTTFNISSNGFIGFSPGMPNGCCSGGSIPSANAPNNIIAAAWTDLYPEGGGGIFYETRGRAPNRFLIVAFQNLPWCCESWVNRVTTQIILYEGTNVVEIHTTNQSVGHTYTQGVEDASGTQAVFIPGRVAANYGYFNDAVRFTTDVSWASRALLPTPRRGVATWTANNILYAIGGANAAGTVLRTVQAYNPGTNSWSTKASLPAPRQTGNGAGAINNIIYLAGGHDAAGALTRTLYAYNPSTNTWSTKAPMPVFSSCGGSAVIAGKLYVFSGCTRSSTAPSVATGLLHRYDPATNLWTARRAAPVPHVHPVVTVTGGKLYVVGGNTGSQTAFGRVDMYDPATNTWSQRATMPTARVGAGGVAINGKVHVIGGRNGSTYLSTVEAYDPMSNSWTTKPSMPTARAMLGVAGISGFLYAVGGRNGSTGALGTNERFTP
jgi:N-acetylneuraminic acid mutarotase